VVRDIATMACTIAPVFAGNTHVIDGVTLWSRAAAIRVGQASNAVPAAWKAVLAAIGRGALLVLVA